jgi:glycosyltransferase involved in cell wall biosynthesis
MMRVWLLHIGEQLPVDGPVRSCRYGYLAQALVDRGHTVLRWAPTLHHVNKRHRFPTDRLVTVSPNYAIQFVHSPGYRRNIGWKRLQAYRVLGRRFRELAERKPAPDLIVAAIPSLEWAVAAIDYGAAHGVPVVIDVRDLWPDVFLTALPNAARPIGRWALASYYHLARCACREANVLTAVSQSYLDWALRMAERRRGPRDLIVPLGYEPENISQAQLKEKLVWLRERGIDPREPTCLFAGQLERSSDVETVIGAAKRLNAAGQTKLQFVVCGEGSKSPIIARRARGLSNVHLLGWVDSATIQAAASFSVIGLCAYAGDALQSLPNKPFEYMANRLAIASSLPGELAKLVERHECGLTYQAGDTEACAAALSQLTSNSGLLEKMRINAYDAWTCHYRSRDIYARFVEHLTSMTEGARAA